MKHSPGELKMENKTCIQQNSESPTKKLSEVEHLRVLQKWSTLIIPHLYPILNMATQLEWKGLGLWITICMMSITGKVISSQ